MAKKLVVNVLHDKVELSVVKRLKIDAMKPVPVRTRAEKLKLYVIL